MHFLSDPLHLIATLVFLFVGGALIGYPFARYFDAAPRHRLLLGAPVGLALLGTFSLPIFMQLPFTAPWIALVTLLIAAAAWLAGRWIAPLNGTPQPLQLSLLWLLAAAVLSLVPAYSVAPHVFHGGIGFGAPIFDHEKVALIDEMTRNGMPPHNPFFASTGSSPILSYYYGWYFLAALAALLGGANGWTTDIVFTWLTAFLSLCFMGWGALRFSGRQAAAWAVLPLCLISTLVPVLSFVLGPLGNDAVVPEHGLEGWIVQSAWVPQHLFGAVLAGLAVLSFVRLLEMQRVDPLLCVMIGALVGFSYNASVWVGVTGLIPVLTAVAFAALRRERIRLYAGQVLLAGAISLAAVAPLALQEAHRLSTGPIIAFWLFPVITYRSTFLGDIGNFIAYWGYMLVLYFGPLYVLALLWAWQRLRSPVPWRLSEKALLSACFLPLLVAELLHSVIATNDLGWRCILVSLLAMTIVAARVLTEQFQRPLSIAVLTLLFVPGVLSGLAFAARVTTTQALYGTPSPDSTRFRSTDSAMWKAVDALTPPHEAVANNPFYEQSLTPWAGNISWAMLSNRATCTPPWSYLTAFAASDTKDQQTKAFELFKKIFNGSPQPGDFKTLRDEYECRTLLVVPSDKLWSLPKDTPAPYFKLVSEKPMDWRIYRATP